MMATVPLSSTSLLPILGTLEDDAAGVSEQTDAYLTIASRLSGEDGRQFFPIIVKQFSRLGTALQTHISSENVELSQAALQALGFCVFNTNIVSGIPAAFVDEILLALCALVLKSTDKNTCTRALWVISKQSFPEELISKKTPEILKTLEAMQTKDMQSVLTDHESLNVVIKLLEQAPVQMGEGAMCWAKLVIPLVVHSASKVRLRAAAALEMGMPLLLEKQQEVAAIVEPLMSSKLIPEMQKLFSAKNESNVLKLWPLFVKLLGKLLHKGGAFINSLLYLEELGFRSSSPSIKKIAFIAWKSLIDNFALNPDILCSSKRLKLLMQPLSSILVRTEALLLTKLEVWWYLVVKLGPNLAANFDQVGVPLLHSTLPAEVSHLSTSTPARNTSQSNGVGLTTPKSGVPSCSSPASSSRLNLNSSLCSTQSYSSIQLLGLEMLLHYFLGTQASTDATTYKLQLSLEPLTHNLLSSNSFFSKHCSIFIAAVQDGFIAVGKDAPEALLNLIWSSLVNHVCTTIEAAGNKKERQGSEVLTLLLQALQSILSSEALPAPRALALLETTVKGIPQKVLGSAAYQVANMDVLHGTPALFLIHLFYSSSLLSPFVADEKFFLCLETLVSCGLCGPTSPLAFGESVLGVIGRSVELVENKEHLWRMWSVVVNPLTDTITQTNEVNQGDALEHNFSAIHSALMFPITHLLSGSGLPQTTQKSMLSTWSRLYKTFARCSALVATAEENVCCEELCSRISAVLDGPALKHLSTLDAVANVLLTITECVDFTPFTPQFQQKMKSPHTPLGWVRKRSKALGNLSTFHLLLVQALEAFQALVSSEENSPILNGIGTMLSSTVSAIFTNLALPTVIQESLSSLTKPLSLLYGQAGSSEAEQPKPLSVLGSKLEKLVGDVLGSLQTRSALQFDDELLVVLCPLLCVLFPHKSKHIRTAVTQFWNATFGNAIVLTYPETLVPILSQAKQKAPLILPGFQAVENSEDFNGQCSSECSQLDTTISGIKVTPVGKRESLLTGAAEPKEQNPGTTSKSVSIKLDFGSPKPPRKDVLEEEASVDFVFIPPEAKERVLTEHQKEVKRTKRVDIPAMYNNLDASLDTTVFTQYTQSQEESMDKLPTNEQAVNNNEPMEVSKESVENNAKSEQDDISPEVAAQDKITDQPNLTEQATSSADISMADVSDHEDTLSQKESQSPNVSSSSDMISATPPKSSSRRQSFVTLEKYAEGHTASSSGDAQFTGPLIKTSGQDSSESHTDSKSPHTSNSQTEAVEEISQESVDKLTPQPTDQMDKNIEIEAVTKCSSEGAEDEDEVIPDTQTQNLDEVDDDHTSLDRSNEELESDVASPEVDSKDLSAYQESSQEEPRRSGRRRIKPIRPGEKKTKSKKKPQNESTLESEDVSTPVKETDSVLPGRGRKSKSLEENLDKSTSEPVGEEESSQIDSSLPSLSTNTSSSQGKKRRRRRSKSRELSETEQSMDDQSLSQTENNSESPLSQSDSQSYSRPVRRTRLSNASNLEVSGKKTKDKGSQGDSPTGLSPKVNKNVNGSDVESNSQTKKQTRSPGRPKKIRKSEAPDSQTVDMAIADESMSEPSQTDSQTLTPVKGKRGRRKKVGKEMNTSSELTPSGPVHSECSQNPETKQTKKNSQRRYKYKTQQSPESLVGTENSECEVSHSKPGRPKKHKRQSPSKVKHDPLKQENDPDNAIGKGDADTSLVPAEMSQKEQEAHLDITPNWAKGEKKSKKGRKSKLQKDIHRDESVKTGLEESAGEEEKVSSQNILVLPEKVALKTPALFRCPHTKRGRGRRRSPNCNCFHYLTTPSEQLSNDSQDEEKFQLKSELLPSDLTLDSLKQEKKILRGQNFMAGNVKRPLSTPRKSKSHTKGLAAKRSLPCSLSFDVKKGPTSKEENAKGYVAKVGRHKDKEQHISALQNNSVSERPQDSEGDPQSQGQGVEDKPVFPEQSTSTGNHCMADDYAIPSGEKVEILKKQEPVSSDLENIPHVEGGDGESTQIDQDLQPETDSAGEAPVLPQRASSEACLDSPPKQTSSNTPCGNSEVKQSPNNSATRGVWSPSASPSTSILKKGQKRQLEDDSPSLIKSRRVSFANPIYQQELADDIDRRSPVIRTSSPKAKATGQPKYITTPTKGLLTLSPRNLRSPGYRSSKKCLISEMGQEPRPIPKDCVYPALVACSTPVEAVLPQISSTMWPRGFGQLVRARNIKTVGDLSALTATEIKVLPIRSPKVSNLRKALKTYHEQQRKGRSDDLKGFEEMEKITSEFEEIAAPPNEEEDEEEEDEDQPARDKQDVSSDVASALEQKEDEATLAEQQPDEAMPADLLSDVAALEDRLTHEELGRCSPKELGQMHEHLSGMMRTIVDHLQSRLATNLEDSLS